MSGTFTVKELIKELLEYDMDEQVYIGLGESVIPVGSSEIHCICQFDSGVIPYGIYLVPEDALALTGDHT